jgi:hypothetical protein
VAGPFDRQIWASPAFFVQAFGFFLGVECVVELKKEAFQEFFVIGFLILKYGERSIVLTRLLRMEMAMPDQMKRHETDAA